MAGTSVTILIAHKSDCIHVIASQTLLPMVSCMQGYLWCHPARRKVRWDVEISSPAGVEENVGFNWFGLKCVTLVNAWKSMALWPHFPTQAKALKLSLYSFHSNSWKNGYLIVQSFPAKNQNILTTLSWTLSQFFEQENCGKCILGGLSGHDTNQQSLCLSPVLYWGPSKKVVM